MDLFDSHNHLQSARFGRDAERLVEEMKQQGVRGCVVNATQEEDWAAVADLARRFPTFVIPAYGIHPWFAHTAEDGWELRLRGLLENDERATVGEIGLDGGVEEPGIEFQLEVFVNQVGIARELGRVVTIHCLKAWEPLFELKEWPKKFLMHSFGGSIEVAERLLKKDAWFSFSGYFLHERKRKTLEVFKKLPEDRILLETDAPEMLPPEELIDFPLNDGVNHPGNLRRIAEEFERELGGGILEKVEGNVKQFWGF